MRKFTTVKDLIGGNSRLNLGFVATIFNKYIGIRLPTEDEIAEMFSKFDAMQDKIAELEALLAQRDQSAKDEASKNAAVQQTFESAIQELHEKYDNQTQQLQQSEETVLVTKQQVGNLTSQVRRAFSFFLFFFFFKCDAHYQIERLESDLQQSKADLIKTGDEKLSALQGRYDSTTADLQKKIEETQKEVVSLQVEKSNLVKERVGLEEKIKRMKELNEIMTSKGNINCNTFVYPNNAL